VEGSHYILTGDNIFVVSGLKRKKQNDDTKFRRKQSGEVDLVTGCNKWYFSQSLANLHKERVIFN